MVGPSLDQLGRSPGILVLPYPRLHGHNSKIADESPASIYFILKNRLVYEISGGKR